MMNIKITASGRLPKINSPILLEGLPGIGNVGKIAADFIVDSLQAKKLYEISSFNFPHSVFVNEDNLVDLPIIEIYYKKIKHTNLLLLVGDIQPLDERSCYEFCDAILNLIQQFDTKEIVTLGGIGLPNVPKRPKVYCTANQKSIITRYSARNLHTNIFGVVGPIVGVTGLLIGLASQRKIPAIALLAQTYSHPAYVGIKGAREVLKILNKRLQLQLNLNGLNSEIKDMEKELQTTRKISELQRKLQRKQPIGTDISYIG